MTSVSQESHTQAGRFGSRGDCKAYHRRCASAAYEPCPRVLMGPYVLLSQKYAQYLSESMVSYSSARTGEWF
jgi:hypothetical protein